MLRCSATVSKKDTSKLRAVSFVLQGEDKKAMRIQSSRKNRNDERKYEKTFSPTKTERIRRVVRKFGLLSIGCTRRYTRCLHRILRCSLEHRGGAFEKRAAMVLIHLNHLLPLLLYQARLKDILANHRERGRKKVVLLT